MTDVLRVHDLHAGYGKATVLNGVDLVVGESERVILLGANGSGKSTVAKTLMGLTTVYGGAIEWLERPIVAMPAWRRARLGLGYVPQVDNVFRSLTVEENIFIGGNRLSRGELRSRLDGIYALFPILYTRRNVRAGDLSGGERRMLALAATLIEDPQLLVLDEPTSDLAPTAIDLVFDKIREVCDERRLPLLMIEQNVSRALELADRVCVLVRGRVVLERDAADASEDEIGAIFLESSARVGGGR